MSVIGTKNSGRNIEAGGDVNIGDVTNNITNNVTKNTNNTITIINNNYWCDEDKRCFQAVLEYIRKCFHDDHYIRLDQAGDVTDRKLLIRNVYTDLDAENRFDGNWQEVSFAAHAVKLGEKNIKREPFDAQQGQRPLPVNIVLLGEAGQGKSTVCQLLCQLYRAALLQETPEPPQEVADYFQVTEGIEKPKVHRIPILFSLKRFAAWLSDKSKDSDRDESQDVMSYLLEQIRKRSGDEVHGQNFRNLLKTRPWLFCFDGLDEVPSTSNRTEILAAIDHFVEHDLLDHRSDAVVVITSRPQGYNNAFPKHIYRHYILKPMSTDRCRIYLQRLLRNLEPSEERRESSMAIMDKAMNDTALSQLLSAPLYAAILLLLARTGGTLPTRRSILLQNYCRTVITREKQKGLLLSEKEDLGDDYVWIDHLHQELAMRLQQESDAPDNPASLISTESCENEIRNYLKDMKYPEDRTKALFRAMTTRLPFLAATTDEKGNPCVLFPLRSIQEYYAAESILARDNHNEISEILEAISISAYWRNVFLLAAGFISADRRKYRLLNNDLLRICRRNCGFGTDNSVLTGPYAVGKPGAWLALDFLREEICGSDEASYSLLLQPLLESRGRESWLKTFRQLSSRVRQGIIDRNILPFLQRTLDGDSFAFLLLWDWAADKCPDEAAFTLENLAPNISLRWKESCQRFFLIDSKLVDSFKNRGLKKSLTALSSWLTGVRAPMVEYFKQGKQQVFSLIRFALTELSDNSALRWLLYQIWMGSNALRDFESDSVLVKESYDLNISTILTAWYKSSIISNLTLKFHPLVAATSHDDSFDARLNSFENTLEELGIRELSALLRFRRNPQPEGLHLISEMYYTLHPGQQTGYHQLLLQSSWCLQRLVGILERGGTAEALLPNRLTSWNELLSQDRKIHDALDRKDLKTILDIDMRFRCNITDKSKPCMMPTATTLISNLGDKPLRPWVAEVLAEADIRDMTGFKEFYIDRNKELRELPNALPLLFLFFAYAKESEFSSLPYPQKMPLAILNNRFRAILLHTMKENLEMPSKVKHAVEVLGNWEAWSFCAFLYWYPTVLTRGLIRNPWNLWHIIDKSPTITGSEYKNIKDTGNQLALFGVMLVCLSGPLTDMGMHILEQDLLAFLAKKEYRFVIRFGIFYCYSIEGLCLLWQVARALSANIDDVDLIHIIAKCEEEMHLRMVREKAELLDEQGENQ